MIAAFIAAALAQAIVPAKPVDVTTLATQAQLQAAITAAQSAAANASTALTTANAASATAATAQANSCAPASVVPPSEVVGGAPGAAITCRRSDAVQPRITRVAVVGTDPAGAWAVTWSSPLPVVPVVLPVPVNTSAEPIVCNVATRTVSSAAGRCWYARTLPSALAVVSSLVSYDVFGASAAGITVQVLAIPATQ